MGRVVDTTETRDTIRPTGVVVDTTETRDMIQPTGDGYGGGHNRDKRYDTAYW